ncbi:MAG: flagellar hook-associated protein FlgL [Sporomusaceae bacterium]|nr:flagellar hook-associated protein FlgL [Sporomusaceae bacterium]
MRITNNIISNNYLSALNKSLERQSQIQEQLADGKAVHRPSDDPIKTIRSLRFNTNLAMNEQFTQTVNDSQSWMNTTDGAMSNLSSIMIRIKELAISADGSKPADALNTIGAEIDQLINQAITIGNSKVGDRYVFSGQADKIMPFERKTITDANGISQDVVVYHGDLNKISMLIKPGVVTPAKDAININGEELFGPITSTPAGEKTLDIFSQLIAIKEALQKSQPDTNYVSTTGLKNIEDAHAAQLKQHTQLGARMSAYEMAKSMLENNNTIIIGDVAANEDLDFAKAIIDQQTSENIYKAALAVGAKIMPPSLVDFLR